MTEALHKNMYSYSFYIVKHHSFHETGEQSDKTFLDQAQMRIQVHEGHYIEKQ